MPEFEALAIESVAGAQSTDDGKRLLLKVSLAAGQEMILALPRDQLMALVEMAALGRTQSDKILNVPPDSKEALGVTWWELGQVPQTGQGCLTLTLAAGGKLDFLLEQAMIEAIHETLQAHLGQSTLSKPDKPPN